MTITAKNAWSGELEELSRTPYIVTYKCEDCGEEKVKRI